MKALCKNPLHALMLILVSVFSIEIYPHSDSTRVTYSSESIDSSDYNYHRKYQYLDINLKDETNMFKIAVPTFNITYYKSVSGNSMAQNNFGLLFSFEKKLNPSLSIYVEDESNYSRNAYLTINTYSSSNTLNWGIRYYFLIKKRIKEGVSGNNCNGLFVDLLIHDLNGFGYSKIVNEPMTSSSGYNYNDFEFRPINTPDIRLNLGLQKRLNNFSYMDTRFYISYIPEKTDYYSIKVSTNPFTGEEISHPKIYGHFIFGLDFKIGLAWGWK
jgi:hypothetical protein